MHNAAHVPRLGTRVEFCTTVVKNDAHPRTVGGRAGLCTPLVPSGAAGYASFPLPYAAVRTHTG
jgi:hypothetical protein